MGNRGALPESGRFYKRLRTGSQDGGTGVGTEIGVTAGLAEVRDRRLWQNQGWGSIESARFVSSQLAGRSHIVAALLQ